MSSAGVDVIVSVAAAVNKGIWPVKSGNVIVLSPVTPAANSVISLSSALLPSKITPFVVDTVSTLFVVVVPVTTRLPGIVT